MNAQQLVDTARTLVAGGKGLLAMDESNPTCNKRFAAMGIPQTEEARRAYRELIITTPGLGDFISGVILYDETIRQQKRDGTPFLAVIAAAGIVPGIKVDTGAKDLAGRPGEKVTEGLDGLRDRLAEYYRMGARFAKWRAVIAIGDGLPSQGCIAANAQALARYAALCQEAGLVPVVEPELLMDGDHTLERCSELTEEVLRAVFNQLYAQRMLLEGMILKPNMVLPGLACSVPESVDAVADATVRCLLRAVPAAVPGVAFLSGGQSAELASARLNAMNIRYKSRMPWELAFSFARAIQQPALEIWRGQEANVSAAQEALYHRARCNRAARHGKYDAAMELEDRDIISGRETAHRANSRGASVRAPVNIPRQPEMRRKFVVGNWKMHTTAAEAAELARAVRADATLENQDRVTVVLCPPFPYLALVGGILKGSRVALGAQNLYPEQQGAFTGEVSPAMVLDVGCRYVILGHSERRHVLGESDAFINHKIRVALAASLDVILCVGETQDQRDAGQTEAVLDRQLSLGLAGLSANTLPCLSIAYEPIWAIGNTGHHATPQQAQEAHALIRHRFSQMFGATSAQTLAIQYGGSVKPENAAALLCRPGVDGALIGGASLHADQFLAIVRAEIRESQTEAMRS
jgi:fructose-bisphosphate aldolase, class I